MRTSLALAVGLMTLSGFAGPVQADTANAEYNLPDLGQPSDTALSPDKAHRLGQQVVYKLRSDNRILDDPELAEYLNHVGDRLARHTDRPVNAFHFYVINNSDINAFALPGGFIGVNGGLIMATQSASELASVMAHEIAHVTQHHIARQMADSRGDTIAALATAVVAAIAGAAAGGGGDAAAAAMAGGMSHLGMQQLSYTRAHEYEADRVGIRDLARSGYDPTAMARFFGMLQHNAALYGQQPPQILLTHPVTSTRMAEAEARAADYPHVKVHVSAEYPYMRARARVLMADSASDARDYFHGELKGDHPTSADRYGYALALTRLSQNQSAIQLMRQGLKAHPNVRAWHLGLAAALGQAGRLADAHDVLHKALSQFPHDPAIELAYADNLLAQNQPGAMRDFLISRTDLLKRYPASQQLLAKAAGRQHRLGEAYYRQARYYAMLDDYPAAIEQLRTALHSTHLSHYNQDRLRALQNQMVNACHRVWSDAECRHGIDLGSNQDGND